MRIACRRRRKSLAIRRHQAGDEQQISRAHRLRLLMQRRRHAGFDVTLARRASRFHRQHVDFDFAVIRREPVLDAGDD
jgi:hypothetical protein